MSELPSSSEIFEPKTKELMTEGSEMGTMSMLNEVAKSIWGKVLLALEGMGLIVAAYGCAPKRVEIEDLGGKREDTNIYVLDIHNNGATADVSTCVKIDLENLDDIAGKLSPETLEKLRKDIRNDEGIIVCEPNAQSVEGSESIANGTTEKGDKANDKRLTKEEAALILKILDDK